MTAPLVADPTALRATQCPCGHGVFAQHREWGCAGVMEPHGVMGPHSCDCDRDTLAALLASGVVQPREDAVRETLLAAADDYERLYQQPGSATGADWLRRRARPGRAS